jgi:mannose-6-phosphate isomerase-like protein (cupin superfamily)
LGLTASRSAVTAFDFETTYVGLDGKGGAHRLRAGPKFWETIDSNAAARGTLITQFDSDADWPHWEMHPKGDEVVYLLEGQATMVFQGKPRDRKIGMTAGQAVVVPKGTWHRALVAKPCRMLFITYGEGTRHKGL